MTTKAREWVELEARVHMSRPVLEITDVTGATVRFEVIPGGYLHIAADPVEPGGLSRGMLINPEDAPTIGEFLGVMFGTEATATEAAHDTPPERAPTPDGPLG